MKEKLKYFTKLSTVAITTFLKINFLGLLSTILVGILGFYLLSKNVDTTNSTNTSAIPFLNSFIFNKPISTILWLISCIGMPFLFFILGNKYIISKISYKLITDKSESFINPLLDKVLDKFKNNQPKILKNAGDFSINKIKLINEIKGDKTENKWLKRILIFGMKKINLDNIDFSKDDINFYEIIKIKTLENLESITKPSRKLIWIVVGLQWAILIFIYFFNF